MLKYLVALLVLVGPAHAQTRSWPNGDYKRGFCDAVAAMLTNRDHYRHLHSFPSETMDQSIKRIYEKWPPRAPDGYDPSNSTVKSMVTLEMAGIDLYVMVPANGCD